MFYSESAAYHPAGSEVEVEEDAALMGLEEVVAKVEPDLEVAEDGLGDYSRLIQQLKLNLTKKNPSYKLSLLHLYEM